MKALGMVIASGLAGMMTAAAGYPISTWQFWVFLTVFTLAMILATQGGRK
jgi:hypothetical protein